MDIGDAIGLLANEQQKVIINQEYEIKSLESKLNKVFEERQRFKQESEYLKYGRMPEFKYLATPKVLEVKSLLPRAKVRAISNNISNEIHVTLRATGEDGIFDYGYYVNKDMLLNADDLCKVLEELHKMVMKDIENELTGESNAF